MFVGDNRSASEFHNPGQPATMPSMLTCCTLRATTFRRALPLNDKNQILNVPRRSIGAYRCCALPVSVLIVFEQLLVNLHT